MLLEFVFRFSLECVFLCGLVFAIFRWGGLSELFHSFDRTSRRRLLTFLAICFFAQCVDRLQYNFPPRFDLFPFARFAMYQYATVRDPVTVYRLEGVYPDGSREHLNMTKEFSAIGVPAVSSRFRVINEQAESADQTEREWAYKQTALFVHSLARKRAASGQQMPAAAELLSLSKSIQSPADAPPERKVLIRVPGRDN